jgi:hypothetical protein
MPVSSGAQNVSLACPACHVRSQLPMWLVIDAEDRPDLIDELRHGRLRTFNCPRCGKSVTMTTSLLVDTRRRSPLLFAPDPAADDQLSREQLFASIAIQAGHGAKAGSATIPAIVTIPHDLLPLVVDRDVEDDLASFAAGTWRAESIMLQRYGEWLARVVRDRRDRELKRAVSLLTQDARDSAGFARVVSAHPVLLTDAADELLATMQDVAEQDAPPEYEQCVAEWRRLLRLCRRDGVETILKQLKDG